MKMKKQEFFTFNLVVKSLVLRRIMLYHPACQIALMNPFYFI
ncbi:hypothetical protein Q7C_2128 [Methylophaga frappieri]|uniref:Uncharacterized protein n=1 Tax=Methylophaga frappieri (strain ATCC BAA-2434 / DSM 25690 / JAM7) TaxID=754477 RepID=I1YK21_METFJ|nr:hypothetical protein Q7C_2128 [Methylophaga frappieri]